MLNENTRPRHYIETVFSSITSVFSKSIHACTLEGFY